MRPLLRITGYLLLGGALWTAVITGRLLADGSHHLKKAVQTRDAGDRAAAVASLEDAAKAYFPGSPYPGKALRELGIMARAAEMRGETERAVAIWEVIRRAVLATRHFRQPNEATLETAEQNLRRLRSAAPAPAPREADPAARPEDPSPLGSLALFLGLVGWVLGATWITLRPRRTDGSLLVPMSYAWVGCLGGLVLWGLMAWIL